MEEYEVSLGDYIRILWKEKWVVLVTFVGAVVLALIISYATPRQYQVQTALLILPPLYQDIGGQITGTVLSPESYRRLALAGDLLEKVVRLVYPKGTSLTPDALQRQMKVEVEQTTAKEFPARFPLYLRVTLAGSDREALVKLAEAWIQIFVEQNTELFMTRTAQSLNYVSQTLAEVEQGLSSKEEELRVFLQENPEAVIQAEVDALKSKYSDYLKSLADAEKQLTAAQAKVKALEEALAQEPQYFVLVRTPSDEALWQFLGTRPDAKALGSFAGLALEDQVLNSTYISLRGQLASAQAELASLQASVAYYREALAKISADLAAKQAKLMEIQIRREQLQREIAVLRDAYDRVAKSLQEAKIARAETAEPIRIVEHPVLPTVPVGPSRKLNLAVAGVLGLFLGVLLAFVVHYFREEKPLAEKPPGTPPNTKTEHEEKPS